MRFLNFTKVARATSMVMVIARALTTGPVVCLVLSLVPAPAFSDPTRQDTPFSIAPATQLIVLNPFGSGFANLRAAPDPRSEATLKLPSGTTGLVATGRVASYGDTWWVEVRSGAALGWLNARLAADAAGGAPLQPFINIDALPPLAGYDFAEQPYRTAATTSFEECARRCVSDIRCQAIAFQPAAAQCSQFDAQPTLRRSAGIVVAAKPAPRPEGGWFANTAARFTRTHDQTIDGELLHERMARSGDECAAQCSAEKSCTGFAYHKKTLICAAFSSVGKLQPNLSNEAGVRIDDKSHYVEETVAMSHLGIAPPVHATIPIERSVATVARLKDLAREAGWSDAYALPDIDQAGHINIAASVGSDSDLKGDVYNLAPALDPASPGTVHLVFYTQPSSPPIILATTAHDTEAEAAAIALTLQRELDDVARQSGLGVDRFALLKPLRR